MIDRSSRLQHLSRVAFFLISRIGTWLYTRFPLFGRLRGAVAIIRRTDQVLVIKRSDGLGWSFPGGRAWPGESDEVTIKREVLEETGLVVTSSRFVFAFDEPIAHTSVFEVEALGTLKSSWEGEPAWVSLPELTANIFSNHAPVLVFVRKSLEAQ